MNLQKERFSQKQLTSESFDNDNKLTLKRIFAFCSVFSQGQTAERWKRLQERHSVRFPTYSSFTLRAKTNSALSFDRINFFEHGEFVFTFSESLCYVLLFSCANKNFLFWHLSNDCQIVHPALVSGPPNRKEPYNKYLISLVFSVRTVNYGSSFFFPSIYGPRASCLGHKSMEKNWSVIYSTDRKRG